MGIRPEATSALWLADRIRTSRKEGGGPGVASVEPPGPLGSRRTRVTCTPAVGVPSHGSSVMATSACTWPRAVFTSGPLGSWRGGPVETAVSLWTWVEMHLRSHGPVCTFQKAPVQEMFPCQCDNC